MKRFFVFAYHHYDKRGGWNDFQGDRDTLEEAKLLAEDVGAWSNGLITADFAQIIDTQSGDAIETSLPTIQWVAK
jgi:hypothetical protein